MTLFSVYVSHVCFVLDSISKTAQVKDITSPNRLMMSSNKPDELYKSNKT